MRSHSESTYLLDTSDVLCDVLDGNGIFDGQSVRLAFHSGFIDQNPSVGGKS